MTEQTPEVQILRAVTYAQNALLLTPHLGTPSLIVALLCESQDARTMGDDEYATALVGLALSMAQSHRTARMEARLRAEMAQEYADEHGGLLGYKTQGPPEEAA